MKASTYLLALASIACASANILGRQEANATAPSAPTTTSYSMSPEATCLSNCAVENVDCRAACVGGAYPNSAQVNQTYECITRCPLSDGSAASNLAWGECQQACIKSNYPTGAVTPTPALPTSVSTTSSSRSAGTTPSGPSRNRSSSATGSPTSRPSASGTGEAEPSGTSNAASGPTVVSAGGLLALFLAFFAL